MPSGSSKRSKAGTTYTWVWYCSNCSTGPLNPSTDHACPSCLHWRCEYCSMQQIRLSAEATQQAPVRRTSKKNVSVPTSSKKQAAVPSSSKQPAPEMTRTHQQDDRTITTILGYRQGSGDLKMGDPVGSEIGDTVATLGPILECSGKRYFLVPGSLFVRAKLENFAPIGVKLVHPAPTECPDGVVPKEIGVCSFWSGPMQQNYHKSTQSGNHVVTDWALCEVTYEPFVGEDQSRHISQYQQSGTPSHQIPGIYLESPSSRNVLLNSQKNGRQSLRVSKATSDVYHRTGAMTTSEWCIEYTMLTRLLRRQMGPQEERSAFLFDKESEHLLGMTWGRKNDEANEGNRQVFFTTILDIFHDIQQKYPNLGFPIIVGQTGPNYSGTDRGFGKGRMSMESFEEISLPRQPETKNLPSERKETTIQLTIESPSLEGQELTGNVFARQEPFDIKRVFHDRYFGTIPEKMHSDMSTEQGVRQDKPEKQVEIKSEGAHHESESTRSHLSAQKTGVEQGITSAPSTIAAATGNRDFDRSLRSLPEIIEQWFPQWFDFMWEPPVPPGAERIRWTCVCGKRLFDDYYGLGADRLREVKHRLAAMRQSAQDHPEDQPAVGWTNSIANWATTTLTAIRNLLPRNPRGNNDIPLHNPVIATTQPQDRTYSVAPQDRLFLLFSLPPGKGEFARVLDHESVDESRLVNDNGFFKFLRQTYHARRKLRSRLTLKAVSQIGHCEIRVDYSNFITKLGKHTTACPGNSVFSCNCWPHPPADSAYRYIPGRPAEAPDMERNYLLHGFYSPQCWKSQQASTLCYVPMKKHTQLTGEPTRHVVGWGIYFDEDWHMKTVSVVISVLTIVVAMAAGFVWWLVKSDVSGGMAIVSAFVATGTLIVAVMAVKSN